MAISLDQLSTPVRGLVYDLNWKIMRIKYESQSLQYSSRERYQKKRELEKAIKERDFWLNGGRKANGES